MTPINIPPGWFESPEWSQEDYHYDDCNRPFCYCLERRREEKEFSIYSAENIHEEEGREYARDAR